MVQRYARVILFGHALSLTESFHRKEFYLRPFSPTLRSVYRSRELRDFHHLLLEKGLRIRVDLDAYLEGEQTSDMEVEDDDAPDLERLEQAGEEVLTERQRLMPY